MLFFEKKRRGLVRKVHCLEAFKISENLEIKREFLSLNFVKEFRRFLG